MVELTHLLRPLKAKGRRKRGGDDGVILVFWALCLPMLAVLLAGVIELGNQLQSEDNAQNAADAAALAAAGYLAQHDPGPMVIHKLQINCTSGGFFTNCMCLVVGQNTISRCNNYDWLAGYYIYEGGQWEAIGDAQVSYTAALSYPGWTCDSERRHHGQRYCLTLSVYPPGSSGGVDGSLSDWATISQAISATQAATFVQQNYGFTEYTGCTPPQDLFVAGQSIGGVNCIAYDQFGTIWVSVADPVTYPGNVAVTAEKTSWAMEEPSNGTAALCSGLPPNGNCQ